MSSLRTSLLPSEFARTHYVYSIHVKPGQVAEFRIASIFALMYVRIILQSIPFSKGWRLALRWLRWLHRAWPWAWAKVSRAAERERSVRVTQKTRGRTLRVTIDGIVALEGLAEFATLAGARFDYLMASGEVVKVEIEPPLEEPATIALLGETFT